MIKDTIKSLFIKGSYTQDVAIVGSGKIIVSVIGFVFIPILSRIYDPEAYGLFSIYNATVTIIIGLLTLNYPKSFAIINEEKTFIHVFLFTVMSILAGSIIIMAGSPIIGLYIPETSKLSTYFFLIPVGVLINGLLLVLVQTNQRRQQFLFSSSINVSNHLIIRIANLTYGLFTNGYSIGLILGNQIGGLFAVIANGIKNLGYIFHLTKKHYTRQQLIESLFKYKNYPRYIFPTSLINNLKIQLPIYFIGFLFGESLLGEFSLAVGLLNIPIQIIGNSISAVFLKKANDLYMEDPEKLKQISIRTSNSLFLAGVIPFSILLVFGPEIFTFLLGDKWIYAGRISSIFSVYFFLYMIFLHSTALLQILKKEKNILMVSLLNIILNILALLSGIFTNHFFITLIAFTISNVIIVLIFGYQVFKLLKLNFLKYFIKISISFIAFSGILLVLKYFLSIL